LRNFLAEQMAAEKSAAICSAPIAPIAGIEYGNGRGSKPVWSGMYS
jgi:hypothetical protein